MVLLTIPTVGGCYTQARVDASQAGALTGNTVVVDVTDRGRVALADSLGPGITRLEGRLAGTTDSTLALRVSRVEFIRGTPARWSGETVTVSRDFVAGIAERRVNRGKTALATALVIGGAIAFLLSVSLLGSGSDDVPNRPGPGPGGEQ